MVSAFSLASPRQKGKKKAIVDSNSMNMNRNTRQFIPTLQKQRSFDSELGKSSGSYEDDNASSTGVPASFRSVDLPSRDDKTLKKDLKKKKHKLLLQQQQTIDRATEKRRDVLLSRKVKTILREENELIQECLAVDEDGYCLRHDDQLVKTGIVKPPHRFETIQTCRSCAFGSEAGVKHKNHGQKGGHAVAHAVNGALKATKIKKKKKKVKGAFDTRSTDPTNNDDQNNSADGFNGSVGSELDYSNAMRLGMESNEFASDLALLPPSMSTDSQDGRDSANASVAQSILQLQGDVLWNETVTMRVVQVVSWDNNRVPLKCHPLYAKYFRMLKRGIPPEEIRESFGADGPDLLLLSLDPNKAFDDQLDGLSPHVQERLRASGALTAVTEGDPTEISRKVYHAYLKQKELFDQFRKQEELGLSNIVKEKEMGKVDRNGMEPVPGGKKKKKLRIGKKFKRIVGGNGKQQHEYDDASAAISLESEEEMDVSESVFGDEDIAPSPVLRPAVVGVGPMQTGPSTGLRRARRPNRPPTGRPGGRSPPRPPQQQENRGVIQTVDDSSPNSSISPSPGNRRAKRPVGTQRRGQIVLSKDSSDPQAGGRPDSGQRKAAASSAIKYKQSRQRSQTAAVAAAAVARNRVEQQNGAGGGAIRSAPSTPPAGGRSPHRSILKTPEGNENVVTIPNDNIDPSQSPATSPGGAAAAAILKETSEATSPTPNATAAAAVAPDNNDVKPIERVLPIPQLPITRNDSKSSSVPDTSTAGEAKPTERALPIPELPITRNGSKSSSVPDTSTAGEKALEIPLAKEESMKSMSGPSTSAAVPATGVEGQDLKESKPLDDREKSLESIQTDGPDAPCPTRKLSNQSFPVSANSIANSDLIIEPPPLQSLNASHESVTSRLSSVSSDDGDSKNNREGTREFNEENFKEVCHELQVTKDELEQARALLSRMKERESILHKGNREKDKRISKLLKTVAALQHTVKDWSAKVQPEPSSGTQPQAKEDSFQCSDPSLLSSVASEDKQGRELTSTLRKEEHHATGASDDEFSSFDIMKSSQKRRSDGSPNVSAYLGSNKQSGENVSYYGPLNDSQNEVDHPRPPRNTRLSSSSSEPSPQTFQREEEYVSDSSFDGVGAGSYPRSSNVREVTPHNRRHIRGVSVGEEQVISNIANSVPVKEFSSAASQESIVDKKKKKRELEERLRLSIESGGSGSGGLDIHSSSKGSRQTRSDSGASEEEL